MPDHRTEVPQSIQAIPSVGAILLFFTEKDVNWWAAFIGLLFIFVQLLYVLWKWRRDIRRERVREALQEDFEVTE
ncbi:hypothetical protein [Roseateles cavernae]|uniref:hypothetical protein n=1 Tax=Roseateles cavernae TaxID=3153578 RepID=UPI0032E40AF2